VFLIVRDSIYFKQPYHGKFWANTPARLRRHARQHFGQYGEVNNGRRASGAQLAKVAVYNEHIGQLLSLAGGYLVGAILLNQRLFTGRAGARLIYVRAAAFQRALNAVGSGEKSAEIE
jgi:hypothetical protein